MSLQIEAELKLESEASILCWDGKLFVGAEDGSIKVGALLITIVVPRLLGGHYIALCLDYYKYNSSS